MLRTCLFFLLLNCGSVSLSQIEDLTNFPTSRQRLENYWAQANAASATKAVVFRCIHSEFTKNENRQVVREITGILLADSTRKLSYAFNQVATLDNNPPQVSESMWLNGKLKVKGYLDHGNGFHSRSIDVDIDLTKTDKESKSKAKLFGPLPGHFEFDALGAPLTFTGSIVGRSTNIGNVLTFKMAKGVVLEEESNSDRLVSKWKVNEWNGKPLVTEMSFDEKQGGMPTKLKQYLAMQDGTPSSEYIAETTSTWTNSHDDNKWYPKRISLSGSDTGSETQYEFEVFFVPEEKAKKAIGDVDWNRIFSNKDSTWFGAFGKQVIADSEMNADQKNK
jgi:hypothetical protein